MASLEDGEIEEHFLALHEIKDALDCTICLDIPKNDPVYQCENGHILCKECRENITDCPVCRVKLGSLRNLAIEKVLAKCPRPCEYSNYGCIVKLTKEALDVHKDVCKYKPLQCLHPVCKEFVPMIEIPSHMNQEHNVVKVDSYLIQYDNMNTYIKSHGQFIPAHLTFQGSNFYSFVWRTFSPPSRWHFWLYIVGTPSDSKSYIYTVKINAPEYNEEFSYKGQPVSLRIEKSKISNMNRCLTIDDECMERFCENNVLKIEYCISCNKL